MTRGNAGCTGERRPSRAAATGGKRGEAGLRSADQPIAGRRSRGKHGSNLSPATVAARAETSRRLRSPDGWQARDVSSRR